MIHLWQPWKTIAAGNHRQIAAMLLLLDLCTTPGFGQASHETQPFPNPDVVSLFGKPLPAIPLDTQTEQQFRDDLAVAQRDYDADPQNIDHIIWWGRRLAYLFRYQDAIDVYSQGIARFPQEARLYRHRGHRYITVRRFEQAEQDLRTAARLISGTQDQVEPDGQPNKAGIPTSTLHTNIWYHLGLVHFLQGDFEQAKEAYQFCLQAATNDDMRVATLDWLYMTLRRLHQDGDALQRIKHISPDMRLLENHVYHRRLLMYRGLLRPDELLNTSNSDDVDLDLATYGFGIGHWHFVNNQPDQAERVWQQVVAGKHWAAFGYLAAEAELWRMAQQHMEDDRDEPESVGSTSPEDGLRFQVEFEEPLAQGPLDGRLLLMLSQDASQEPRFQMSDGVGSQQIFGLDVEGWHAGERQKIETCVSGYPRSSLREVQPGMYTIQALLHLYETFHRADGHVVKLPMDRGEGQQWNRAPGNLLSTPRQVTLDPHSNRTIRVQLNRKIPAITLPADTKHIRHVKIQSKRLTEFWGRPMYLGAHVLLPADFDQHPEARYPVVIFHGHFPHDIGGFRPEPPDPNLEPVYSQRFRLQGYNRIMQEYAHKFYQDWTSPDFPRVLLIEIQHANPYYDDSYAVNSANVGPYGDAITYELIPFIEKQFRGIGAGWARFLYGGSTGGWEALAAQVFYPDEYNGCFAACPDPIDFRAYTVVNIYEDENAYYHTGPFGRVARPGKRDCLGHLDSTLEQMNQYERILGTRGRSGQQWDIWQAVYSPVGKDGYPQPIWDKRSGQIDHSVAEYWREHYDLSHIIERDWKTLGPKLQGKINIYVGDMDNYYLNNAVYLAEQRLRGLKTPPFHGVVDYGDRAEHCWNGDHSRPNAISRLRYHQMYLPKIMQRLEETAPSGMRHSWKD